jgi:O-antigen ligase
MYRRAVAARVAPPAGAQPAWLAPQPWDALLICLAVYILIAMARVHAFIPGMAAIRPGLIIAGVSIVLALGKLSGTRGFEHLRHPYGMLMLFFVAWAAIGAPFAFVLGRSVSFLLDHFFRTGVLVLLLALSVRNFHDVRRLAMILAMGGMVFAYFAALPAAFRRVGGGGYDPNDSAMFMVLTLPLIVHFLMRERRLALKILLGLAVVLCVVGVVRTGSRGGFLAFGVVLCYMIFFFNGVKPILRVLTVGGVAGVMAFAAGAEYWDTMRSITDPDDYNYTSTTGRKAIWARARGYMLENPIMGAGINNFVSMEGRSDAAMSRADSGRGFKWSAPHSHWYQVGVELGFPGLFAFAGLFVGGAVYLRRMMRYARRVPHDPLLTEASGLASALIGSLLGVAVAGSFLSNAYGPMTWGLFGLVLGFLKVMRFHGIDVTSGASQGYRGSPVRHGRRQGYARRAVSV